MACLEQHYNDFNKHESEKIYLIAGHDPTNAAGTSIDLLVANEFDMHCLSAISNLTVQDAKKVAQDREELNVKLFKKPQKFK